MAAEEEQDFWERPEVVARFAEREPDARLVELLKEYPAPASTPVLDLGCAGGRNAVLLAQSGFDVHAADASRAMVEETRRRLAAILGDQAAADRVHLVRMDDLAGFPSGSFDLVVALGVFQNAQSWGEWEDAVAEADRVLAAGGRMLVAHFSPETDLTGEGLVRRVPGEHHVFDGLPGGRHVLLTVEELDAELARFALHPMVPTTTGTTVTETGKRVSVNGLYRKS